MNGFTPVDVDTQAGMARSNKSKKTLRNALIAGATGALVLGAGVGAVFAATTPGETDTGTEPAAGASSHGGHAHGAKVLHGEAVVDRNGTTVTQGQQTGTVEAVSASSVTVKSSDGFTQTYAIGADSKLVKAPAKPAAKPSTPPSSSAAPSEGATPSKDAKSQGDKGGKRPAPTSISASDIKSGDTVRLVATKSGSTLTVEHLALQTK